MASFLKGCTLLFGGSGGIGSEVVRTFARAGSDVAIVYHSKHDKAEAIAADVSRTRGITVAAEVDPTRPG